MWPGHVDVFVSSMFDVDRAAVAELWLCRWHGPRCWKWLVCSKVRWTQGTERVCRMCVPSLALEYGIDLDGWHSRTLVVAS